MDADLSDSRDSRFLLSLDLLETLDLFSETRASESRVLYEREDVSDLVCGKDPLLPVMLDAGNDKGSRLILRFMHYFIVHFGYFLRPKVLLSNNLTGFFVFPANLINCSFTSTTFSNAILLF